MKREFLMLAHDHVPAKHGYHGFYMSKKLDGMRAFWDGGVSRQMGCDMVPWANIAKHGRFKTPPIATGLWTRYGQPIQAPAYWLDTLPKLPLDGELVCGDFQNTMRVCKDSVNVDHLAWKNVHYFVFDSPSYQSIFYNSEIKTTNYKKKYSGILEWLGQRVILEPELPFYRSMYRARDSIIGPYLHWLEQELLPNRAKERVQEAMNEIYETGGEGLMLRGAVSFWRPERSHDLLKVKVRRDMEGTVIGYRWGKATDIEKSISGEATDRLLGLMGSLRLRLDSGVEFDLASGFTLEQRRMTRKEFEGLDREEYLHDQGKLASIIWQNDLYPRGSKITFQYRELTNDGIPKEARFWRVYGQSE